MIDVILIVFVAVVLGLIWTLYKVFTDKPTHEDKLDQRKVVTCGQRLDAANALLTELKIIDGLMPMLPADFKTRLNDYLGGRQQ